MQTQDPHRGPEASTIALKRAAVEMPAWSEVLFDELLRYIVLEGGRGSGKSWAVADALVMRMTKKRLRWLCTREFQKSVKQSVHQLLKDTIARRGVQDRWTITDQAIVGKNGSLFIFEGLHANVDQIKSKEGLDGVWVEEAETVSAPSWRALVPTIRKPGSQIIVTFNPRDPQDATWQLTQNLTKRGDARVLEVNWRDNPFFPDVLRREMEEDFKKDADLALHVWEGKFRKHSAATIFKGKTVVEEFKAGDGFTLADGGMDFGFSNDPFSAHKYWVRENTLFVEHELYRTRLELRDIIPELLASVPGAANMSWKADSSRPETISFLRGEPFTVQYGDTEQVRLGLNVAAADKWPGSVEDGIAVLKSLDKIVIHPRCAGAAKEASLYSYKVDDKHLDPQGQPLVLNSVVDAYNHFWDDCRYAMGKFIRSVSTMRVELHRPTAPSPLMEGFDDSFLPAIGAY